MTRCLTVKANEILGPVTLREQGFLHGIDANANRSVVSALRPHYWRVNSNDTYDQAKSYGAQVTWVISDSWREQYGISGQGIQAVPPPWSAFPIYDSFVKTLVSQHSRTSRRPVDFWDIWPESTNGPTGTSSQILDTFRHAYLDIRQADPTARIGGPSLGVFAEIPYPLLSPTFPNQSSWHDIDYRTFLDFAAANNLRFDVISWEEILAFDGSDSRPEDVGQHASWLRQQIAARPSLGTPRLHINEYSNADNFHVPGWTVAWLEAMERANVDWGSRACWDSQDSPSGPTYSGCSLGVDGLLQADEKTPMPLYWVHESYASMSGDRVSTASSSADTVAYATRDDHSRKIVILAGRYGGKKAAGTSPVGVLIEMPEGVKRAQVEVVRIPDQSGALAAPIFVSSRIAAVEQGHIDLTLPAFDMGDAYRVTTTAISSTREPTLPNTAAAIRGPEQMSLGDTVPNSGRPLIGGAPWLLVTLAGLGQLLHRRLRGDPPSDGTLALAGGISRH
ncbi:MAG: hypothetical protein ACYDGR_09525 [Candidatus Dormibacteria bacterium]